MTSAVAIDTGSTSTDSAVYGWTPARCWPGESDCEPCVKSLVIAVETLQNLAERKEQFFLAVGLFLHSAAAIILVVPIVMPLVNLVGIDPVHFGIILILNLGIGLCTPPVGTVLFVGCGVAGASLTEVVRS